MSGPAIIFDTETTSKDDDREIIEAAWLRPLAVSDLAGPSDAIPRPVFTEGQEIEHDERRFLPTKPISFGSMAVHHILPSELEGCWPSEAFRLPDGVEYIAGHSIDFDWEAAGRPPVKRICTFAMANWIWPDADSYSQSALLYMLLGPTPETRRRLQNAHSAMTDVLNNAALLEQILAAKPEITTWSQLYAYSEACRIPRVMPIGEKQGVKGLTLAEAVEYDTGFVYWCLRQDWLDPYLRKGLELALNPPPAPEPEPATARGSDDVDDDIPF